MKTKPVVSCALILGLVQILHSEPLHVGSRFEPSVRWDETISVDVSLSTGDNPKPIRFALEYPVTSIVSESGAKLFQVYLPKVIPAPDGDSTLRAELQSEFGQLHFERYQVHEKGLQLVEDPAQMKSSGFAFKRLLMWLRSFPTQPLSPGDKWKEERAGLTMEFELTGVSDSGGVKRATIEGMASGKLTGPDQLEFKIEKGRYKAVFAIEDRQILREEADLQLNSSPQKTPGANEKKTDEKTQSKQNVEPSAGYHLQLSYRSRLEHKTRLNAAEYQSYLTALSNLEKSRIALNEKKYEEAKTALEALLQTKSNRTMFAGTEDILKKLNASLATQTREASKQKKQTQTAPRRQRLNARKLQWLVLGPVPVDPQWTRKFNEDSTKEQTQVDFRQSTTQAMKALDSYRVFSAVEHDGLLRPSANESVAFQAQTYLWTKADLAAIQGDLTKLPQFSSETSAKENEKEKQTKKEAKDLIQKIELAYVVAYFKSPDVQQLSWQFGSDSVIRIWLNGNEVWRNRYTDTDASRNFSWIDPNRVTLPIQKGWNSLVLKTARFTGDQDKVPWNVRPGILNQTQIVDTRESWDSFGEINCVDGYNAVVPGQQAEFSLKMDVLPVLGHPPIDGFQLMLPAAIAPASFRLVEPIRLGDHPVDLTPRIADGAATFRFPAPWTGAASISMRFSGEVLTKATAGRLEFRAGLLTGDSQNVRPLAEGDVDLIADNANGLSRIAVVTLDSEVIPPESVTVEPVAAENDIQISWKPSEDPRIQGYEVVQGDQSMAQLHHRNQTRWVHRNLPPGSQQSYLVRSVVNSARKSKPSHAVSANVGQDTTTPEGPASFHEAIPFGEKAIASKAGTLTRTLSWKPGESKDVRAYEILRSEAKEGGMQVIAKLDSETRSFWDADSKPKSRYSIRTIDDAGLSSETPLEQGEEWMKFQEMEREFQSTGQMDKLHTLYSRSAERYYDEGEDGGVEWFQRRIVVALAEQKALDPLIEMYRKLADRNPKNFSYHNVLALALVKARKPDEAMQVMRRIMPEVALDPVFKSTPYYTIGKISRESRDPEAGIEMIKKGMESMSEENAIWLNQELVGVYASFKMEDKILQVAAQLESRLTNAVSLGTRKEYVAYAVGDAYMQGKLYEKAVRAYKNMVFNTEAQSWMSYYLANAYEKAKQNELAKLVRNEKGGSDGLLRKIKYGFAQAPDRPLVDLSGTTHHLAQFKDDLLMLCFISPSLPNWPEIMAELKGLQGKNQKILRVFGVVLESEKEKTQEKINSSNPGFPVLVADRTFHDLMEFASRDMMDQLPAYYLIIGSERIIHQRLNGKQTLETLQKAVSDLDRMRFALNLNPNVLWASRVQGSSSQYAEKDWSASQILGPPDVYPGHGDQPKAWASQFEDAQPEWIEVGFETPKNTVGIRVYETFNAGAISSVELIDPKGVSHRIWEGKATAVPDKNRIFRLDFPVTDYPVASVRVHLDSRAVTGWNQIDAVGIVYSQTPQD